jgi:hypothetical protein
MRTQLLCTFATKEELHNSLQKILHTYNVVYNYIYVLQNKSNLDELFITYNINSDLLPNRPMDNTILIHRKKETNTLYTINALNELIREENGTLDTEYVIDWDMFKNSIILTNPAGTKRVQTRIYDVISVAVTTK